MVFRETPLPGTWVVDPEPATDERGDFARTYDADEFAARGLEMEVAQCSTSRNLRWGTLRGLHYQVGDHAERKLVRCTAGAVYDVVVDLRRESPTHTHWHAVELSSRRRNAIYIPRGVAHGFQTLVDGSELLYMIDRRYEPGAARGVRWDDPAFAIEWPAPPADRIISARDLAFEDYAP
jgi:dTDP-4-dehydrorhamnose 3,5-epimerase